MCVSSHSPRFLPGPVHPFSVLRAAMSGQWDAVPAGEHRYLGGAAILVGEVPELLVAAEVRGDLMVGLPGTKGRQGNHAD